MKTALTPEYIRECIELMREWDREYADYALARVKANVPWLMKEKQHENR